jgi:hypothetical protein
MSKVSPETIKLLFETFEAMNQGCEEMYKLTMAHNQAIKDLQRRITSLEKKLDN